jgi:hypothetical protein
MIIIKEQKNENRKKEYTRVKEECSMDDAKKEQRSKKIKENLSATTFLFIFCIIIHALNVSTITHTAIYFSRTTMKVTYDKTELFKLLIRMLL